MQDTTNTKRTRMASFEEDDGRKRMVSMAGRNKDAGPMKKEDLMRTVREERERRALEAKKEKSAVMLQRIARGMISRRRSRSEVAVDVLRKISDLGKLEKVLAVKQPRFAPGPAALKLIRACLYVGDVNNEALARGLVLAVRTSKPSSDEELGDKLRHASVMKFAIASPYVSVNDVERMCAEEPTKYDLAVAFPQAILRAAQDSSFVPLARRALEKAFESHLFEASSVQFAKAFVAAARVNSLVVSSLFVHIRNETKSSLFVSLASFARLPSSASYRKSFYGAGDVMLNSKTFRGSTEMKESTLVAVNGLVGERFGFDIVSFVSCLYELITPETDQKLLAQLCASKRVGVLIEMAAQQSPQAILKLSAFLGTVSERENKSKGLSLRSLCFLGAITPYADSTPPVMRIWDILLKQTSISLESSEMEFACGATSLLLDTLDDQELFLSSPTDGLLRRLEQVALLIKTLLFETIWVKVNAKPNEVALQFFTRLYERCSRHFNSNIVSKDVFLFPAIPSAELGLGASSSSTHMVVRQGSDDDDDAEENEMEILTQSASPRGQLLLKTLPFAIPFQQRVILFHRHLESYRAQNRMDDAPRWNEATQQVEHPNRAVVQVRRDTIVEDAFNALKTVSNLQGRLRVQFVNDLGLDEAGIDGGGLFKEFITSFCQAAFDPAQGLFQTSSSANHQLYPTPQTDRLRLLEFVGKMLGKAVFENILVEINLSPSVLNLLSGRKNSVNDLVYLDPELYRSLMSLKHLTAKELEAMSLTFVATSLRGDEVELIPNGLNIPVTRENVAVFVERMVDYKLNRELRIQIDAFARGFNEIIEPIWVRLFSPSEIEMLIGGTSRDFDVMEMKKHAVYSGGYHPTQPYVQEFWDIVANEMTPEQRGKLLKFITSCSRPPLTGFGSLDPKITIYQVRDDVERLPTASTCVNLLKLPKYPSREILKQKLITAIESGAGFELS